MPLEEVFAYFRRYDRQAFHVVACQGNEPSEDDIAAFEDSMGTRLPADFRRFTMSGLGGLYVEVLESLWPRPKALDVGPFWTFLYGLKVFGIAEGIPPWLDLRIQASQFRARHDPALIPFFARIGDADRYCFDREGNVLEWHHDGRPADHCALSFPELLLRELNELEERKDRKVRGEGSASP